MLCAYGNSFHGEEILRLHRYFEIVCRRGKKRKMAGIGPTCTAARDADFAFHSQLGAVFGGALS